MHEWILNMAVLDYVTENLTFTIIILVLLIVKLENIFRRNIITTWLFYLPGTVLHETAHFILSLVTLGMPSSINLLPKKDKETGAYFLGYVTSKNMRWYNTFFISMAPFLIVFLSYWLFNSFFNYFEYTLVNLVLYVYFVVITLYSSIPSSVDFKNVFSRNVLFNLIVPILLVVGFYTIGLEPLQKVILSIKNIL